MSESVAGLVSGIVDAYADEQGLDSGEAIRLVSPYLLTLLRITYFGPYNTSSPSEVVHLLCRSNEMRRLVIAKSPEVDKHVRSAMQDLGRHETTLQRHLVHNRQREAASYLMSHKLGSAPDQQLRNRSCRFGKRETYVDFGHTVTARLLNRFKRPMARHISGHRLERIVEASVRKMEEGVMVTNSHGYFGGSLGHVQLAKETFRERRILSARHPQTLIVGSSLYWSDAVRILAHFVRVNGGDVIGHQHGGAYLEYVNEFYVVESINATDFRTSFPGDVRPSRSELLLPRQRMDGPRRIESGITLFIETKQFSDLTAKSVKKFADYCDLIMKLCSNVDESIGIRFKGNNPRLRGRSVDADSVEQILRLGSNVYAHRSYRSAIRSRRVAIHFGLNTTWMDSLRRRSPFVVLESCDEPKTAFGFELEDLLRRHDCFVGFDEWGSFSWESILHERDRWTRHTSDQLFRAVRDLHLASDLHSRDESGTHGQRGPGKIVPD